MKKRKCSSCGKRKSINEFYKGDLYYDGFSYYCKLCSCNDSKDRYKKDPEKGKKRVSAWRENNRERYNVRAKTWKDKNFVLIDNQYYSMVSCLEKIKPLIACMILLRSKKNKLKEALNG